MKKLGNRKKIEPERLDRATHLRVTFSLTFTEPTESTLPTLSPIVMYSLDSTGVRLENHFRSLVMCQEQPESINQKFSKPPTCKIKNGSESEQMTQHCG
jgi:hypothetical protein